MPPEPSLREMEAADPFQPHDPGCTCWPHVSQRAAIEGAVQAATTEYRMPPDPSLEQLAVEMSEAYTYLDRDNSRAALPFIDDFETFWEPFAALVLAGLAESGLRLVPATEPDPGLRAAALAVSDYYEHELLMFDNGDGRSLIEPDHYHRLESVMDALRAALDAPAPAPDPEPLDVDCLMEALWSHEHPSDGPVRLRHDHLALYAGSVCGDPIAAEYARILAARSAEEPHG